MMNGLIRYERLWEQETNLALLIGQSKIQRMTWQILKNG